MTEIIELNVGGTCFTTTRSTLKTGPSSMLACMFSGDLTPSTQDKHGRYFIDRSPQHFGTVLAYLRGEQVDMLASKSLIEEAKYYQLEGLMGGLTACSEPETASSLAHYCEILRQNVGCDVIDAVEDALVNLWASWAHVPRSQPEFQLHKPRWGNENWTLHPIVPQDGFKEWVMFKETVKTPGQGDSFVTCSQCSSALDLSNHERICPLKLCMKKEDFERPICTKHWQGRIHLRCCENPDDQIRGADAANFAKILYKCYGIIVRDLRDKGFTMSMKFDGRCACTNKCGLAAHITICLAQALFER